MTSSMLHDGPDINPGELALVNSWRGIHLAFRTQRGDVIGWCVMDGTDTRGLEDGEVTGYERVLVLNPKSADQINRLADLFRMARFGEPDNTNVLTRSAMRQAVTAMLAPPKPDEPAGLGAVVEDDGELWIRCAYERENGYHWRQNEDLAFYREWSRMSSAVRILTPGITPDGDA